MEAFDGPAMLAPAELPAALVEAVLAARATLIEGGQPSAVVLLVELVAVGTA